jgi:hypothetical protein
MGNANVNKEGFVSYAKHCGQAMALAHCRGDRRSTRFEQAVCAALPLVRNEVTKIAQNYANTVKEDFLCFKAIEEKT